MAAASSEDLSPDRLNELYWQSDRTVDSIMEELGVGKKALYASIRPLPSEIACSTCGHETVYTTRTQRVGGSPVCLTCANPDSDGGVKPSRDFEEEDEPQDELDGWTRWREDLRSVPPQRVAMIGGAAALGAVVGAAAARALRRVR